VAPSIGRIVVYRSRTGDYSVPAIVTATQKTLNPKGVEAGHVPPLTGEDHVHLTVFTPGAPGLRQGAEDFKAESVHPRSENVAGCYQEWDIPPDPAQPPTDGLPRNQPLPEQEPGTWRWPERV
jgi:hypothetical protein